MGRAAGSRDSPCRMREWELVCTSGRVGWRVNGEEEMRLRASGRRQCSSLVDGDAPWLHPPTVGIVLSTLRVSPSVEEGDVEKNAEVELQKSRGSAWVV